MLQRLGEPKRFRNGVTRRALLTDVLNHPVPLVHDGKVAPEMLA